MQYISYSYLSPTSPQSSLPPYPLNFSFIFSFRKEEKTKQMGGKTAKKNWSPLCVDQLLLGMGPILQYG